MRVWSERLGLGHWALAIDLETPTEGVDEDAAPWATIWRAREYEDARLRLHAGWRDWSRLFANRIIVHELVHLWTREVEYVLDLVDGQLHRDVDDVVARAHRHGVEMVVDRIAKRLVDLLGPV